MPSHTRLAAAPEVDRCDAHFLGEGSEVQRPEVIC